MYAAKSLLFQKIDERIIDSRRRLFLFKAHLASDLAQNPSHMPRDRSQMLQRSFPMALDILIWQKTTSRNSFAPLPDRPTSYLVDFGRALCLFGGHLASPSTSEQLQIYECIIETCIFEINSFIVKFGAYIASRRRNYWPHLPSVMSLVANDIWGAAVLRRMASSIHPPNHRGTSVLQIFTSNMHGPRSLISMPGSISMA